MSIKKLQKDTNSNDALEYLKKRHRPYFEPKVIDEGQIESKFTLDLELIDKLKLGLVNNRSSMDDVEEEEDFDFDYDDDFDD